MRAPFTDKEKTAIIAMAERGIHTLEIAHIMRCRRAWVQAVLTAAADGQSIEVVELEQTKLRPMDENVRYLAMSRNGQRRAPLRLQPLPIPGRAEEHV